MPIDNYSDIVYYIIKIRDKEIQKMKKMMWGKTIAKVYIKFWNGEKMVRTVYLDEEKNRYVKINGKLCLISKLHADVEFY